METTVQLTYHDPRLLQEFEQTRSSLLHACQGYVTSMEHIGSTAIAGMIGRRVVDCVAGVLDAADIEPAAALIEGLNFRVSPLPTWAMDDGLLLTKPRHGSPTHQVFLTTVDSPLWNRVIAVRDLLREDCGAARRFAGAKVYWWRRSEGDPTAYEQAKSFFFIHCEEQISTR